MFSAGHESPAWGLYFWALCFRNQGYEARVIIEETSGEVTGEDLRWADMVGISSITSTIPRAFLLGDQAKGLGKESSLEAPMSPFYRMRPCPMVISWSVGKEKKP